jgi:nitrite reductase/ring-hydroxylating ferredoxin subunit
MLGRLFSLFRGRPLLVPGTDQLPEGESRKVDVGDIAAGGKQIILCRVEGKVYALDSLCPHEGGRIQPGPLARGCWAVCPLHNYGFDPRTGKARGDVCRDAQTYRTRETDQGTEVWV